MHSHAHIYTHRHTDIHSQVHRYTHTGTPTCTRRHTDIYTGTPIHTQARRYTLVGEQIHTQAHRYTLTGTKRHTGTHIHTYTYKCMGVQSGVAYVASWSSPPVSVVGYRICAVAHMCTLCAKYSDLQDRQACNGNV
jgi:hypothetical protein